MNERREDTMRRARLARERLERELRDVREVTMVDIGLAHDDPDEGLVLRVHVRGTPPVSLPRRWDGFEVVVVAGDYRPEARPRRTTDEEDE